MRVVRGDTWVSIIFSLCACAGAGIVAADSRSASVLAVEEACVVAEGESSRGCSLELLQRTSAEARGQGRLDNHGSSRRLVPALVDAVYTYGAPATHRTPLRNAAAEDECFPGLRSYTEDLLGAFSEIHQVDAASMNNYYPHALTNMACLHWQRDSYYTPCYNHTLYGHPAWPKRAGQVYEEWRLHQENDYTDRLNSVTVDGKSVAEEEPFLTARFFVVLAYKSYDTIANTKQALAEKMPGWKLVARVVDRNGLDEDPVMLVQDNATYDCALVFTGTNDFGELSTSTTQYGTGYCGFRNIHVGYRNELWTITGNVFPKLRPKLERCNMVTCVGHSLGGALCEIFAACANSGNYTDPDYKRLAWKKKTPELLPEMSR